MNPANFEQSNGIADTPKGVSPDAVQPLCVFRGTWNTGDPYLLSCWRVTAEELAEIQRTGRVWLFVMGRQMPPVLLMGSSPFEQAPPPETPFPDRCPHE